MKLSTKGRYGVKAMLDLALNYGGKPITIKSISGRQGISECYLEQLFSPLRRADLVTSVRGAQGGYVLSRHPKDITVLDIMNVLEGPIEVSECLTETSCCNVDFCATRGLWSKIKDSFESVTRSVSLQDMVNDNNRMSAKRGEDK